MRHDLIGEMSTVFGNMNEAERRAYSLGISHAYADVFTVLMQASLDGHGLPEAAIRFREKWHSILDIQTKMGVL